MSGSVKKNKAILKDLDLNRSQKNSAELLKRRSKFWNGVGGLVEIQNHTNEQSQKTIKVEVAVTSTDHKVRNL
jgi:hypothetical protein